MLLSLKEVLPEKGRAVGAFDVVGLEWAEAVLEGAETLGLPVILSVAPHLGGPPLPALAPGLRHLAEAARVPVALHLDHGETLEEVVEALRLGFTGVMLDGSHLPLEENIRLTRLAVEVARAFGAGVEGEVGVVPGHYGPGEDREAPLYTDPLEAEHYLAETGVDALAVSIGTRHGLYKGPTRLNLPLLERLSALPVPLVLHGASGLSPEEYRALVQRGIRKINLYADLALEAARALREVSGEGYLDLMAGMKEALKGLAMARMRLWWG
ncbi:MULTISPECIES: class II fructose-bisphosphate aldolase [Thermus]|jgi:ketose-bisphosphate aldolase|uniref:Fructose/tagatose bisphosphate aldolase n=1 Tax=Thermus oshimai JL-2 TaxID=751945 RepID=K7QY00_THEOS|nr:class II fructose-bisphosphate aldolase [Thermus oshimai]AFV76763.1 fructose/tagatose bisphosphate aldolase [Thermus oshimai JL-2]